MVLRLSPPPPTSVTLCGLAVSMELLVSEPEPHPLRLTSAGGISGATTKRIEGETTHCQELA